MLLLEWEERPAWKNAAAKAYLQKDGGEGGLRNEMDLAWPGGYFRRSGKHDIKAYYVVCELRLRESGQCRSGRPCQTIRFRLQVNWLSGALPWPRGNHATVRQISIKVTGIRPCN